MIRDQIDREGKKGRVADKSIDDTSFAVCASKSKEEVDIWFNKRSSERALDLTAPQPPFFSYYQHLASLTRLSGLGGHERGLQRVAWFGMIHCL